MKTFVIAFCALLTAVVGPADSGLRFDRDIRPILAENCFACHGPDDHERKAGLRLDTREGAVATRKDGQAAVVPGDPAMSLLLQRVAHADMEERMPPEATGKQLDEEQVALLRQWIAEGAAWEGHWAFAKPSRPAVPKLSTQPASPVDAFVFSRLNAKGMTPSPLASRETLIRRVSLDLRGIPPTLSEIDAFLGDAGPNAYGEMVDRMLASPHYGEKMCSTWLDLARYGDTNGYHFDSTRPVWVWRDWVIRAFNNNMPFDQFTIDQLAGDLHPDASVEQQVASGFNRNARFNEEGGADPEEWLVRYAIDRTSTLGQVWLGLTLNCAECHSHKYDPISQKEFYELYAFFNSLEEVGAGGQRGFHNKFVPPFIKVSTPETKQKIAEAESNLSAIEAEIRTAIEVVDYKEPLQESGGPSLWPMPRELVWVEDALPGNTRQEGNPFEWVSDDVKSGSKAMRRTDANGLQQHFFTKTDRVLQVGEDDKLFAWIKVDPKNPPRQIMLQWNHSGENDGWDHRAYWGENLINWGVNNEVSRLHRGPIPMTGKWVRLEVPASEVGFASGASIHGMAFTQVDGTVTWDRAGIVTRIPQGLLDTVWIDDEAPPHRTPGGNWVWSTEQVHSGKRSMKRSGPGQHQHFFADAEKGLEVRGDDILFTHVFLDPVDPPKTLMLQFFDDEWEHRAYWGEDKLSFGGTGTDRPNHRRVGDLPKPGGWVRLEVQASAVNIGSKPLSGWAFTQFDGTVYWDTAGVQGWQRQQRTFRSLNAWAKQAVNDLNVPDDIRKALTAGIDDRIRAYFIEHVFSDTREKFQSLHERLEDAQTVLKRAQEDLPSQLVSKEMPEPRPAHILIRGNFEKKGEQVQRGVPEIFPPLPAGEPVNRMALAKWLVSGEHPLTARVTVNRLWAQLFGRGIVETEGDFGTQGKYPTHPELLDWLAVEFVESGWDVKALLKQIVVSETYRQSSNHRPAYRELDPGNHMLSRAPRFRVSAEEIRDITLHAAGLLSPKIGGEPVFPFQPRDYYRGKKGGWSWKLSEGEDAYRRGMYTFWRRTTPYPTFMIFDMQDRSDCVVRRPRTNTPLQALTTLNEDLFVEAARALGRRMLQSATSDRERAIVGFRLATGRLPGDVERNAVVASIAEEREHFKRHVEDARALSMNAEVDPVEHATFTAVANALLNLDETLTRE